MIESSLQESAVCDVRRLYEAVMRGGSGSGSGSEEILSSELMGGGEIEWWFHGPQGCHYMMNKLTGKSRGREMEMEFEPRNMEVVDDHVIVEGWEGEEVYWVHVWTMREGVITQFREYFNTCLTVRDVSAAPLWQSHPHQLPMPGLMLAI